MFQKYKYVYALYKEQSFTKAAEKLFISQPSLSAAIKGVEKNIGAPLFERTGTGLMLTDVGKVYIEAVEKIVKIENECSDKINDIHNMRTGSIVVGGTNYLSSYVLPKIINDFTLKYPNVKVTIAEGHSDNLREMLKNDEVDIILDSFQEFPDEYAGLPLKDEKILLCVPANRSINSIMKDYYVYPEDIYTGRVNAEDIPAVPVRLFKDEKYIALKKGNAMYLSAREIFKKADISPKVIFSVDQMNIAYAMAQSGIGFCFATDTLFRYGNFPNNIALYNIEENFIKRTLFVAHKKSRYTTKVMEQFINISKEIIR